MKPVVRLCMGTTALAIGLAATPAATAAATAPAAAPAARSVSPPQPRRAELGAPRLVNMRALGHAVGARHPALVAPFRYARPGLTAAQRAAAVRSGGRRSGVTVLPASRQTMAATTGFTWEAFPTMSLSRQVSLFGADQSLQPPDTQIAAGPGALLEMDNDTASVWSKTGPLLAAADLNVFFGVPASQTFSDPRVLYDAGSGRWLASGFSFDASSNSQAYLAVSTSSDPAKSWFIHTVNSSAGVVSDQPMTGVCDDKVVMSWNNFNSSGNFTTAQTLVLQKSSLLAGVSVNTASFSSASEFRLVPAQSLSPTTTCWLTVNKADSALPGGSSTSPALGAIAITGTPDASDVAFTETDLPMAIRTHAPPLPRQPSGHTNDSAIDDRLLSAVWWDDVLWTSGTDACTPAGDTTTRDCLRLLEVLAQPRTTALLGDSDLATSGLDEYYPAVSMAPVSTTIGADSLYVSYSASSPSMFPGAFAVIDNPSVGPLTAPLTIAVGRASYNGGTTPRWGDYSAAVPDPAVLGAVWVAGEYAPSDAGSGDWATGAAEVSLMAPPPTFTPFGPVRMMDTRNGTGGVSGPVGPGATVRLQVAGADGLPASGVTAVVLNVTAVNPTAGGYVTVFEDGPGQPGVSNLNFTAGETIPNLVTVPVGPDGKVDFFNAFGSVNLVADVSGYYSGSGSVYQPVFPVRMMDTRNGTGGVSGPVGPGATVSLQVAGAAGLPASGVTAVVLNVTAVNPTAGGYVTVFPGGQSRPGVSNLNFTARETIPNLVIVPVGSNGKVNFFNAFGSVNLVADVSGYYSTSSSGSLYQPVFPVRMMDTRNGTGGVSGPVGPGATVSLQVAGAAGLPASGVTAVVLNVTAVNPTAGGYVTVFPGGQSRPGVSNLNFTARETIPNLVIVPVGSNGKVAFFNAFGSVNLVADVFGYFTD